MRHAGLSVYHHHYCLKQVEPLRVLIQFDRHLKEIRAHGLAVFVRSCFLARCLIACLRTHRAYSTLLE